MKLNFKNLFINFLLAFMASMFIAPTFEVGIAETTAAIVATSTVVQYVAPTFFNGLSLMALQTEVWVAGIQENPVPDNTFVFQSRDLSEFVENNKIHLAEAGVERAVHEDYFSGNEDPLPIANITDIPNEVVLHTYSTDQTRHRQLQEIELQYNRRQSIINRHRNSLAKNMSKRASHAWSPDQDNAWNKVFNLAADDSVIDALIDLEAFYADKDITSGLNICFNAQHMARIKKEDKKLYKEILDEGMMYGFRVFRYSGNPLYTTAGVKKPFGAVAEAGDKVASFAWATDEVFRCFGDTEMYMNLRDSGIQADTLSFAQRALVGKIRANSPKYLGAIL